MVIETTVCIPDSDELDLASFLAAFTPHAVNEEKIKAVIPKEKEETIDKEEKTNSQRLRHVQESQEEKKEPKNDEELEKKVKVKRKKEADIIKSLKETTIYATRSKNISPTVYTETPLYGFGESFFQSDYEAYSATVENWEGTIDVEPRGEEAIIDSKELSHYIERFTWGSLRGCSYADVSLDLRKKAEYFTMFMFNSPLIFLKLVSSGLGTAYASEVAMVSPQAPGE